VKTRAGGCWKRTQRQSAQQESPKSQHTLDDPKDRLHRLLPQFVFLLSGRGRQPVFHHFTHAGACSRHARFGLLFQIGHGAVMVTVADLPRRNSVKAEAPHADCVD
jgi:hypothetical protein